MDMTSTYHLNIFKSSNDFVTDPLILILNCFQPGHGGDPAWRGNPVWFAQENLSRDPQAPQGPGCHAYPLHAGAHYNSNVEYPMIPQEWFLCIFARTLPWPSVLRVCFFSVHLVMIMMVMAMPRYGTCSAARASRFSSGLLLFWSSTLYLARYHHPNHHLIKINNHHHHPHQKLHLLWLFSIQSHKFTNHPGLLRQYHCIESNCNNSIQLKKVPSLFFYFIKCTRFAGGVLQCTKPLRCWSTCRLT